MTVTKGRMATFSRNSAICNSGTDFITIRLKSRSGGGGGGGGGRRRRRRGGSSGSGRRRSGGSDGGTGCSRIQ